MIEPENVENFPQLDGVKSREIAAEKAGFGNPEGKNQHGVPSGQLGNSQKTKSKNNGSKDPQRIIARLVKPAPRRRSAKG